MTRWFIKNSYEKAKKLREKSQLPLFDCMLLANRGIEEAGEARDFLSPSLDQLHDPFLFEDMPLVVDYILNSLDSSIPIQIIGDYDQDGVAATAILVSGIRKLAKKMGQDPFQAVSYAIPNRVKDGYGINERLVDQAIEEGAGLIITCDNGISAFEALDHAQKKGIPLIVTDHHQLVEENGKEIIPPCEAFLNPHSKSTAYPFKDLCGAGVALKVIEALYQEAGIEKIDLEPLIALASLGTICDLVPLYGENRVIAYYGLKILNENPSPGIQALLSLAGYHGKVTAYTVGFIIGPCINASGRLMTARLGVELFLEEDPDLLQAYASELVKLNNERKEMTRKGSEEALQLVQKNPSPGHILALYLPGVHESLCGLIAGRIKDRYYLPTLVFTDGLEEEGEPLLKGSGRSIESYNMYQELARQREEYVHFGGHAMACGMTIRKKDFSRLQALWNQDARLEEEDLIPKILLDGSLGLSLITAERMETIEKMEPFGIQNPRPIFGAKNLNVLKMRLVGEKKNVLQILMEEKGTIIQGVVFQPEAQLKTLEDALGKGRLDQLLQGLPIPLKVDICYSPEWNEYRGQRKLQLRIRDFRPTA